MLSFVVDQPSCHGFCERCQQRHILPLGASRDYALGVMEEFRTIQRLDYLSPKSRSDPSLSFKHLLPGDRGHMFGVMECRDPSGQTVWLRAFSSLGTGVRDVPGWSPYLLDTATFNRVILPRQQEIKHLTTLRNQLKANDPKRAEIEANRRQISRDLMPIIHDLYFLKNFRGECRSLREVYNAPGGLPGGVGDCCAPRLLTEAIEKKLRPMSIAEFYWGGANSSGRKQPGQFFEACAEKCQPIMGFMLCGLND
jgi:hypothetical protein